MRQTYNIKKELEEATKKGILIQMTSKHKKHIVPNNNYSKEYDTDEDCDGKIFYNNCLQGRICSKCDYYDGVK